MSRYASSFFSERLEVWHTWSPIPCSLVRKLSRVLVLVVLNLAKGIALDLLAFDDACALYLDIVARLHLRDEIGHALAVGSEKLLIFFPHCFSDK